MEAGKADLLIRLTNFYTRTAAIWLNISILMLLFFLACYVFVWIWFPDKSPGLEDFGRPSALHTLSRSDAARCFAAFDSLQNQYRYRQWVGFSEPPFESSCLHIDAADPLPVRRTINTNAGQPSKKTIWLFGGSTQFGYGVPDNWTIASQLSGILSAEGASYTVVNHGHEAHYSSQEAALFTTLLRHGQRADIAIFLDGLNDFDSGFFDTPKFTDRTAAAFLTQEQTAERSIVITPLFPPLRILSRLLARRHANAAGAGARPGSPQYDPESIYRFNRSSIERLAEAQNIRVAFFWQPTPFDYLSGAEEPKKQHPEFAGMPQFNLSARRNIQGKSFHFIADMFKDDKLESIYLDSSHYGDEGSRRVAQAIVDGIKRQQILQ